MTSTPATAVRADQNAGRRRGGRRRGERLMVPKAEFTSYYGRSVLKAPTWEPRDVASYLFFGGLAGASSVLALGADVTGRPALARVAKLAAVGGLSVSVTALVHDLGRPARFVNMLRVLKPTSPMSIGSWLLAGYGPCAALAAGSELTGIARPLGRAAGAAAGVLGTGVATYTAVLVADTAVPAWHEAYAELPFLFAGSAAAAASGLALTVAPVHEAGPARRLALAGAALESVASQRMTHRLGLEGEPYRTGRGGGLLRASRALTVVGVAATLLGRRSRVVSAAAGAALLASSVCTRFGVFAAGVESATDPRYTVVPQRERLDRRALQASTTAGAGATQQSDKP